MLYEIGWSTYDIRYIIIMLCFIPLLIAFILFQKKYDTSINENDNGDRASLKGSKWHTKFMISLLLIVLMLTSLSPAIDIYKKNDAINCYKNGEYDTFTGMAYNVNKESNPIRFENEKTWISFYDNGMGAVKQILKNEIEEGKIYTVYYTGKNHDSNTILRIDKVN